MSREVRTDILVVGAGPCGLAVGAAARDADVGCVMLDKGPIVSSIQRYPIGMTFFSTAENLEIGGVPFVVERDKPTRSEALAYYRRVVRHLSLDVRQYHTVSEVARRNGDFLVHSEHVSGDRRVWAAAAVVVATGYFDTPNLLGVPGEERPHVTHYFRDPHLYFDQDVLVIGGGNSAVEAALTSWRAGARVTMAHLFDGFDRGVKPWILPDVRNRIETGDIRMLWRHRVEAIESDAVRLRNLDDREPVSIPAGFVLAMTGFRPDPGLLESLGVVVDASTGIPRHDSTTMETTVPGVYIAGVLAAGYDANRIFIENGREHGGRIVRSFTLRGT